MNNERARGALGTVIASLVAATLCAGWTSAPPRRSSANKDVTIVTLNLLHGAFCPPETDNCQANDRVALFGQLLEASKCPDVVALQEISESLYARVTKAVPTICDGRYKVVWHNEPLLDRELVLTTYPLIEQRRVELAERFRDMYLVRLRSPLGTLALAVTHAGAGADNQGNGGITCDPGFKCPPPCEPTEAALTCQIKQILDNSDRFRGKNDIGVLVGDFNVVADSPPYNLIVDDGWRDTYLAVGNRECVAATGKGCTSGRQDETLDDLKNPKSRETERIDFIFLKSPKRCRVRLDPARDRDGDGLGTGLWANKPAKHGPGGLAFPSDHTGTAVDLSCGDR